MGPHSENVERLLQDILEENCMHLKKIPEVPSNHQGPNSLMRAVSCCLYMTSIYHAKIQKSCVDFLASACDEQVD